MSEKGFIILHNQSLLPMMKQCKLKFYDHCVFDKQTRAPFHVGVHNLQVIVDYIHSTPSHSKKVNYVSVVYGHLKFVSIYFMQQNSKVLEIFKNWKILVET